MFSRAGLMGDFKTAWVTLCSARSMFVAQASALPASWSGLGCSSFKTSASQLHAVSAVQFTSPQVINHLWASPHLVSA